MAGCGGTAVACRRRTGCACRIRAGGGVNRAHPQLVLGALSAAGCEWDMDTQEGLHGSSVAVFSGDRAYRYLLTRRWGRGPTMTWLMLNPSTADAFRDDPTVLRCQRRAVLRQWRGIAFGGIAVVNLFALRSTDPAVLRTHPDPAGPGNDACLRAFCRPGDTVVAAWGSYGTLHGRGAGVAAMLTGAGVSPLCLGTTASGQPRHPGRLAYGEPLVPWLPGGAR